MCQVTSSYDLARGGNLMTAYHYGVAAASEVGSAVSSYRAKARPSLDRAAFHTAHTPHTGLGGQFVQQRLGVFKVRRVEALGEPVVDFGKRRVRFVAATFSR